MTDVDDLSIFCMSLIRASEQVSLEADFFGIFLGRHLPFCGVDSTGLTVGMAKDNAVRNKQLVLSGGQRPQYIVQI
jgi:hypothetical protein